MTVSASASPRERASSRLVGGAAIAITGKLGYALFSYSSFVLAARFLQPTAFGLYTLAVSLVTSLAIVGSLGCSNTVLALVPKHLRADPERARGILTLITRSVWIASGLLTTFTILVAGPLTVMLGQPAAAPFLRIVALSLPFAATLALTRAGLQAAHAFSAAVITSMLLQAALLQGALLLVILAGGLPSLAVAWCYTVSFVIAAVVAVIRFSREPLIGERWLSGRATAEPGLTVLSLRFLAINFFLNLKWSVVIYVIAFTLAADELALFGAALRTATLVSFILVAINFVFAPLIAALWHDGNAAKLARIYRRATKWSLAISLPACIGLVAAGPGVMALFGPTYQAALPALGWLAFGQLVNAGTGSVGYVLMMIGKERTVLHNTIGVTVASAVGAALVTPAFGVTGAAAVVGMVLAAFNILMLLQVRSQLGMMPYDRETGRVLVAGVLAAGTGFAVYPFAWAPQVPLAIGLLLSVGSVGVVYAAALFGFGLTQEDRALMTSVIRRPLRQNPVTTREYVNDGL